MLIAKLYPQLSGRDLQDVSDRAFILINKSGNGFISKEEFCSAYINLKQNNADVGIF